MKIGVFSDVHDHVDYMRRAVEEFNRAHCDLVLFAGDFVSPIVIPPLRKLACPLIGCFGDNEGNKTGILGGTRIIGDVGEPPFGVRTADGTRILLTHVLDHLKGHLDDCDVVVFGHTHRASVKRDDAGRLFLNPGETSGWTYRQPSVAILETQPLEAKIVRLDETQAQADNE